MDDREDQSQRKATRAKNYEKCNIKIFIKSQGISKILGSNIQLSNSKKIDECE